MGQHPARPACLLARLTYSDHLNASKCTLILAVLSGLVFFSTPAFAVVNCTFTSVTDVVFGSYNPLATGNLDADGTLSVTCSDTASFSVTYTVKLSTGAAGTFSPRRMYKGGESLTYNLYRNAARTLIWGDGTAGTVIVTQTVSDGSAPFSQTRNHTVRGRTPLGQDVSAGSYTDAITATVEF